MPPITIQDTDSGSLAKILPELGFNLYHFSTWVGEQSVDVIEADDDFELGKTRPSRCGIPILFPFPNRIRHGKFTWDGKEYQIPVANPTDHAIHGFCLDRPWRVSEQGENFVTGEFQLSQDAPDRLDLWPADFQIQCTYQVVGTELKSRFTIHNPDSKPLPWGFGTHAYFKVPLTQSSTTEDVILYAEANKQWPLEDFIPTGEIVDVPELADLRDGGYYSTLKLDDVLTDLVPGQDAFECRVVDERAGIELVQSCDRAFRELVVYTPPDRDAVCMEPYTCPTDAINLEARGVHCGWEVLDPEAVTELSIDLSVLPIIA